SGSAYRSDVGSFATRELYRAAAQADLRARLLERFFVDLRLEPPLCSTEAFSASIRSTTFGVSFASSWIVIVCPLAFFLIKPSTRFRYSSWYLSGSKSVD